MTQIPRGAPDAAMLYIADHPPDRCGHGKTWDQECPACASVWRQERVADLHKQATKYGFQLAPMDEYAQALLGAKPPSAQPKADIMGDDLRELRVTVEQQAEEPGLWVRAVTPTEAMLQHELRRLHSMIECSTRWWSP